MAKDWDTLIEENDLSLPDDTTTEVIEAYYNGEFDDFLRRG